MPEGALGSAVAAARSRHAFASSREARVSIALAPMSACQRAIDACSVGGAVKVEFANAPAGMKVVQSQGSGGLTMRTDVGYNSDALGAVY